MDVIRCAIKTPACRSGCKLPLQVEGQRQPVCTAVLLCGGHLPGPTGSQRRLLRRGLSGREKYSVCAGGARACW